MLGNHDDDKKTIPSGPYHHHYYYHPHLNLIPLTTHSRREWTTVTATLIGYQARYQQLLTILRTELRALLPTSTGSTRVETKQTTTRKKRPTMLSMKELRDWFEQGCFVPNKAPRQRQHEDNDKDVNEEDEEKEEEEEEEEEEEGKEVNEENEEEGEENCEAEYYAPLIHVIRTNERARRLTSLLFGTDPIDNFRSTTPDTTTSSSSSAAARKRAWRHQICSSEATNNSNETSHHSSSVATVLFQLVPHLWPHLLALPYNKLEDENKSVDEQYTYDLSIIVPSYREDPSSLANKLSTSLHNLASNNTAQDVQDTDPNRIELIIVHVVDAPGVCTSSTDDTLVNSSFIPSLFGSQVKQQLQTLLLLQRNRATANRSDKEGTVDASSAASWVWPSWYPTITVLDYHDGGGRGPCLNYGAHHAHGKILTFLHADTTLRTPHWDTAIVSAFSSSTTCNTPHPTTTTTCCAFAFGIDSSVPPSSFSYTPPGLRAVECTANLRSTLFALPYGDQCFSLPTTIFRYVGGYPEQCLMEDYELVRNYRIVDLSTTGPRP